MTLEELQLLLAGTDYNKVKDALVKLKGTVDPTTYINQYNIDGHDVMDKAKRPDKIITNENGEATRTEAVTRIAVPMQKLIAQRAAAFLCANPIQLNATPAAGIEETMMAGIQKIWDDNKLDFDSMDLAEKMMSETEVAELWYVEAADETYWADTPITGKFKLRMMILANSLGDSLYPVFDNTGNLIAFGRGYKLKVGEKDEEHFDVYLDTETKKGVKSDAGWTVTTETNPVGKIPVIFYSQNLPEWYDVQSMIDRLEKKVSNHGDTNDYFDSPILFVEGDLQGMGQKGDSGKVLIGSQGSKASYVSWDHAPESTKMEIDNLLRFIYSCTDTPDISFENLKGLGTTSGFALEMMFMGAHLKAARHAGPFGKCIQRRINYIKAALAKIDVKLAKGLTLTVKPKFEFFVPKDIAGMVNMLTTAVTGGILSKQTAINNLAGTGVVADPVEEKKLVDNEASQGLSTQFN